MKLRNKKTGDIVRVEFLSNWQTDDGTEIGFRECNTNVVYSYNSLAELNEEWEDVPDEPKDYWYLNCDGSVIRAVYKSADLTRSLVAIGNHFDTPEEAEKAVEKLEAWKRLKDNGISFETKVIDGRWYLGPKVESQPRTSDEVHNLFKDIMFIFGGDNESN